MMSYQSQVPIMTQRASATRVVPTAGEGQAPQGLIIFGLSCSSAALGGGATAARACRTTKTP